MGPYLDELERRLESWDPWSAAGRRIVVGHSFGGMLLIQWLLRGGRSRDVDAAMLVSTTAGPMFLHALREQDMFLAGSFVMFVATLTVIGTLVSDLLLAAVDPRIRYS